MHNTWFYRYNFLDSDQLRVGCAMSFPLHCNGPSMLHNIGGNGISRPFIRRTLFSQLLSIEVLFTNGWILVIFHFRGFFPLDGDNFNVFGEHATTPITLFYVTAGVPTVSTMHYALLIWVLQTINKLHYFHFSWLRWCINTKPCFQQFNHHILEPPKQCKY